MDECTAILVIGGLVFLLLVGGMIYLIVYSTNKNLDDAVKAKNKVKMDYVNSVSPTDGTAEDNEDLLTQMRPSDSVVKYVDLKCIAQGKPVHGFIAITQERLIFKAITTGDHTAAINSGLANNTGSSAYASFRFDLKEETANIPVKKVTSMSSSVETVKLDGATGCGKTVKPEVESVSAYILMINAQGVVYRIFLGTHQDIATEFVKTFISMQYDDD